MTHSLKVTKEETNVVEDGMVGEDSYSGTKPEVVSKKSEMLIMKKIVLDDDMWGDV